VKNDSLQFILIALFLLSCNDLLFYAISIILMFYNLANAIPKLPEDDTKAPKHVAAFVL
jgi:hypothetical protein